MWNSRSGESTSVDPPRTSGIASGSEPNRAAEGIEGVVFSAVIGKGMVIKGEIKSRESLHIDGEVQGNLELPGYRLTLSREGKLGANVIAREIELMGTAHGDLHGTSKITIRKGAHLVGDLRAPGILIEEGAYVKGKIEIINSAAEHAADTRVEPKEAPPAEVITELNGRDLDGKALNVNEAPPKRERSFGGGGGRHQRNRW